MHWTVNLRRGCLHALQLAGAIAALKLYTSTYDGIQKDYRWKYAITICAFSIIGVAIQAPFRFMWNRPSNNNEGRWWPIVSVVLSGFCSGILFLFWTGVLGTFARSFARLDSSNNNGIRMMKIAVYIDVANMMIWFLTVADMIVEFIRLMSEEENRNDRLAAYEQGIITDPSFVPHGWNEEDIEAQALAIQTDESARHATVEVLDTGNEDPEMAQTGSPLQAVTSQIRRTLSHHTRIEAGSAGRSMSDRLSLRPEELQNFWSIYFDRNESKRECSVCCEERPSRTGFPSKIASTCTDHDQDVCRICIDRNITTELENNAQGPIHCIQCRALLNYEEIKALASPTTFFRYERMGLRGFVNNDPNFVWCQNPECTSGQEHVGGEDQPIVTCQACGFRTCFKHQIPWHEEMLCDEYDERVRASKDERRTRKQQELASLDTIHKFTKPCANKECKAPIQRSKGCDHMQCKEQRPCHR